MSLLDGILTFWVLPSLTVLFIFLQIHRFIEGDTPRQIANDDWKIMRLLSFLWPLGVVVVITGSIITLLEKIPRPNVNTSNIGNILFKERSMKRVVSGEEFKRLNEIALSKKTAVLGIIIGALSYHLVTLL